MSARMLLLDLQPPCSAENCGHIQQALEQFFSLACSLTGPCRLPFCGIITLSNYPEVLFPIQPIKGNFPRLLAALRELGNLSGEGSLPRSAVPGLLADGVREATTLFKRQAQSLLQTAGYWSQLEITVFTWQEAATVTRQVERITKELDVDSVKKVQVVSLNDPERTFLVDDVQPGQGSQSSDRTTGSGEIVSPVDAITLDNNVLSIRHFLMGWLHDIGTDKEHMHLILPKEGGDLVLKCDIQERLLNPGQLPFHSDFNLSYEGQANGAISSSGIKGGSGQTIPIHRLRVVAKVPVENVCESVLYGQPLIIRATTCWKVDWDELDVNQQHFLSFCHLLSQKDEVALTHLDPPEDPAPFGGSGFRYQVAPPRPRGYFLLLPSQKATLLLKSVAVSELLLPTDFQTAEQPSEDTMQKMEACLNRVEVLQTYNPLRVNSGLHDGLVGYLTQNKSAMGRQRNQRDKAQAYRPDGDGWRGEASSNPKKPRPMPYGGHGAFPTKH